MFLLMSIMFEICLALMLLILKFNVSATKTYEQCRDSVELSEVHYRKSSLWACFLKNSPRVVM